ncbi:hypothetical protein GCM10027200_15290 [Lentzea nigeriaca]
MPADGGIDADAERAGEDRGGDLGGELEQRGAAGWAGRMPSRLSRCVSCCVPIGRPGCPSVEKERAGDDLAAT